MSKSKKTKISKPSEKIANALVEYYHKGSQDKEDEINKMIDEMIANCYYYTDDESKTIRVLISDCEGDLSTLQELKQKIEEKR